MSGDFAHPLFGQLCTTGFTLYDNYEQRVILAQAKTLAEAKQTALDLLKSTGKEAILIYEQFGGQSECFVYRSMQSDLDTVQEVIV